MRYVFVIISFVIFIHLFRGLLKSNKNKQLLAVLDIEDGSIRMPVTNYETTLGRSRSCDVVIPLLVISRQHAVLTMISHGRWRIKDTGSTGGILVNGKIATSDTIIGMGDIITIAGMKLKILPPSYYDGNREIKPTKHAERGYKRAVKRAWRKVSTSLSLDKKKLKEAKMTKVLVLLNIFQFFAAIALLLNSSANNHIAIIISFLFIGIIPWIYRTLAKVLDIHNTSAEMAAFFLTTFSICTTASVIPSGLYKQLIAILLGLCIFVFFCLILKNLKLVMKLRRYVAMLSIAILGVNFLIGTTINGQTNWIDLGFITIQPSEFVKILFVFSASATLEWLMTTKNIASLTAYAVAIVGLLVLMGDFGTALIFFIAFIVLVFMTSGDLRAIAVTFVTAGLGGFMVLNFLPYISRRFSSWRNVWDHVYDAGYQQAHSLMSIASGGLFGLGAGNGVLGGVFAADTDLVFGVLAEEWGLIISLIVISIYPLFLYSAIRSHRTAYSSYYVIAAVAAASIFLFQAALNIFGTTDILPLTGVTLPFVSNGGSSMAASWGLLSFITAALNYGKPPRKRTGVAK